MSARRLGTFVLLAALAGAEARAQTSADPAARIDGIVAAAEQNLRDGELHIAESLYRSALMSAWIVIGTLRADEQRFAEARDAFQRASTSAVDAQAALELLARTHLQMAEPARAVTVLTRLAAAAPKDVGIHRLLAQALIANGQPNEAVQELDEAHGFAPDDAELTFTLATGYLRLKKIEMAERLFKEVTAARPLPQTYVLIGRAYRDAGEYDRARTALNTALKLDPRVRHAHLYLGTLEVMVTGATRFEKAIDEFQRELEIVPGEPVASLRLGMALVESRRYREALAPLQRSVRSENAPADAFFYLGRCLAGLGRDGEAVAAFRRALEMSQDPRGQDGRLRAIHYQLALALRNTGAADEAEKHFAEAQRFSAKVVASDREQLGRYLADIPDPNGQAATPAFEPSPLAKLTAKQRSAIDERAKNAIARTYMNLGVMQAQAKRFGRAAEFFEDLVGIDPSFPRAQYSLGVSLFNAQQYEKAIPPLARALSEKPDDDIRRMLALAYLNTDAYDKAAAALRTDPGTASDASLGYAYGLALVRSNQIPEAERVFSRLIAEHGDTPELTVVIGQAHAQQGDYDGAIALLQKALRQQPNVADANATLGFIYFTQGRLKEAEAALRAELAAHTDNIRARHTLAAVLDLDGRPEEALPLLRSVLKTRPGFANARYLLGKILLAQGAAVEAVEQLEAAARLAAQDANIHYQLGQAYQKLGRAEEAQKEFDTFRELKEKRRGSAR